MVRRLRAAALLVALVAGARGAGAQGTALVLPSDPAYRDLDRLGALGALDSAVVGQRPHSRREIARLAGAAEARLRVRGGDSATVGRADREALATARALLERFDDTRAAGRSRLAPLDGASLTALAVTHERRALPGPGREVEATIGPFGGRRLGDSERPGRSAALEVAQRLEPFPWLAFTARQRLELRSASRPLTSANAPGAEASSAGGNGADVELLVAAVRARARNVVFAAGRSPVAWSQETGSGLLLASDGPALDHLSVGGDRPFTLPGLLRHAGPVQATLVLADLGPSRVRSQSKLLAYKVSASPARDVEVGGSFVNRFGGAGARDVGLGDRLIDFLPFIDIFRRHNYTDSTRTLEVDSDKMLGLDGRIRLARLGVLVSGELVIDDFDVHRLPTLLTWDGSQSVRITAPRFVADELSLALTAIHTGIRAYSHHELTAGHATRGRLLGDELGPDAKAFGAELGWRRGPGLMVALEGRAALHSKADYTYVVDGTSFALRRLNDATNEQRDRLTVSLLARGPRGRALAVRLGAVRSRNHAFGGGTRHDALAEVSLLVLR